MNTIFQFDLASYTKGKGFYFVIVLLFGIGLLSGMNLNLSVGQGVYLNSPYTIGLMMGLLSLIIIFIASVIGLQLLFKEWDSRFDALLFTTPLHPSGFYLGRLAVFFLVSFSAFACIMAGLVLGYTLRSGSEINPEFHFFHYIYPLIVLGGINTIFICSFLSFIAWTSKNKMLLATGGLLIYILYMVALVFSNSPIMANATPQSLEAQFISSLLDPFGLSAYATSSLGFTPEQRNGQVVPLSGVFLINRLLVLGVSALLLFITYKNFSFTTREKHSRRGKERKAESKQHAAFSHQPMVTASTFQNTTAAIQSIVSFVKTDLIYLLKGIPFFATAVFTLFYVGMEMYAEIEKGIRLPQKYASSGLMTETINQNLPFLCILAGIYFINDLYWRSKESRFHFIEQSTFHAFTKTSGHAISSIVFQVFLSFNAILLGVVFQIGYNYPLFDVHAYATVFLFTTAPAILFTLFSLQINALIPHKYIALAVTLLAAILLATPVAKKFIALPLLRFFTDFQGSYSDFVGYGSYVQAFAQRIAFGFSILALIALLYKLITSRNKRMYTAMFMLIFGALAVFVGASYMNDYVATSKEQAILEAVQYEKTYKLYTTLPQPVITQVKTEVHLYPTKQAYTIIGQYTLKNKSDKAIEKILLEVNKGFSIQHMRFISKDEQLAISNALSEIQLSTSLQAGDSASLDFEITYEWKAVNGHQSFNAIVENGSFMRISRYYPRIGYQAENELSDEDERMAQGLGKQTPLRKLEDSTRTEANFIHLDMIVSTDEDQTAVGTGTLLRQWKESNRNYFHYSPQQAIPFRFAVSSARYAVEETDYKGVRISVMYHPLHAENVQHLIANAKLTLDYCNEHFGAYPYPSIVFAEVSSFTSGFAATAYPAVVYMTEQMVFHANIQADEQQDVINELAGHELSHMWWGGNVIVPDDREGAPMLTETLAMYTEMMLYKKMYGIEKMKDRLAVHEQIYEAEKGFSDDEPLYKVRSESPHISYSKGAMVMSSVADLIGEDRLNVALKNFIDHHAYPHTMAVSSDLIEEILAVSPPEQRVKIRDLFMK